ncbi:MAG: hypothetical protein HZB68_05740 [Candidatus Aenigmarchaeota archaeon]|nr:hypothetical protein [Candidatus Aenigmarchaeota archaeon]
MELLRRDSGNGNWVDGGLDFGYGRAKYAFYFKKEWSDPLLKAVCGAKPVIAVFGSFLPALGAAMKHVVALCESDFENPEFLLACEHASYVHRPGRVLAVKSAADFLESDADLDEKSKGQMVIMERAAVELAGKLGGIEAVVSKKPGHVNGRRFTVISQAKNIDLAIEEALIARYCMQKDVNLITLSIARDVIGKSHGRPDVRIICKDEIFANGQRWQASNITELKRLIESNRVEYRDGQKDVLEGFVEKRRYFV